MHANTSRKTTRNSFYVFRQQGYLLQFKDMLYTLVLFYTTRCLFHNFIFFCSNNSHIFINCALKSEYPPWWDKG